MILPQYAFPRNGSVPGLVIVVSAVVWERLLPGLAKRGPASQ